MGDANPTPYVKDGINNYLVHGQSQAVNPEKVGTKAAAHYQLNIEAGGAKVVRLRLTDLHGRYQVEDFFTPWFNETLEAGGGRPMNFMTLLRRLRWERMRPG